MPGRTSIAGSFLKAGNLQGAEREAKAVLEDRPHDRDALEVLISVAIEKSEYKSALAQSENWIAREPDCKRAHQARILTLSRAGKRRKARKALQRYRRDFPSDRLTHDSIRAAMETASGNADAAIQQIDALRQSGRSELPLDAAEAIAKSRAGRLIGASRAADRMLEIDPLDPRALYLKAVNAFRLCRLSKARTFARRLRSLDPGQSARANELIWASYVAYFPPFLITQFVIMLVLLGTSRVPKAVSPILCYMAAPVIGYPLLLLVKFIAETSTIPDLEPVFFASMGVWFVYALFIFQKLSTRLGSARSVELSRTY